MYCRTVLIFYFLVAGSISYSQNLAGTWEGIIASKKDTSFIKFSFAEHADGSYNAQCFTRIGTMKVVTKLHLEYEDSTILITETQVLKSNIQLPTEPGFQTFKLLLAGDLLVGQWHFVRERRPKWQKVQFTRVSDPLL